MNANFLKTFIGISALCAVTACTSDDEPIIESRNQTQKAISFNVTNNRATRGTIFSKKEDINQFYVSAWARKSIEDGTDVSVAYFTGDNLTLDTDGTTWKYPNDYFRYWPNNGETLDFFAYTNGTHNSETKTSENLGTFDFNDGAPKLTGIEQKGALDMNDIIYAATFAQTYGDTKPTSGSSAVSLKFNHALAQVAVNANATNPKLHIEVSEVALVNIASSGDFVFPTKPETATVEDGTDTPSTPEPTGTWNKSSDLTTISVATLKAKTEGEDPSPMEVVVDKPSTSTSTFTYPIVELTGNNPFMVLPGTYTATTDPSTNINTADGATTVGSGTCIRMKVKIWNISSYTTAKATTDTLIYGSEGDEGYTYIFIPVAFNWEAGKKYTYTISFGTGHAGFDINGDPTITQVSWDLNMSGWDENTSTELLDK